MLVYIMVFISKGDICLAMSEMLGLSYTLYGLLCPLYASAFPMLCLC